MDCEQMQKHLSAYLDNETPDELSDNLDNHINECAKCSAVLGTLFTLQNRIKKQAPISPPNQLQNKVKSKIAAHQNNNTPGKSWSKRVLGPALISALPSLVLGWGLGTMMHTTSIFQDSVAQQFIDAHIQAQMVDHLVDVLSTDGHTVKPWFQGKLRFSPSVPKLSEDGFELLGGRLDYVNKEQVAGLVYKRRQHVINVFVSPAHGTNKTTHIRSFKGYNTLTWQTGGLEYWVVSDLNKEELNEFVKLYTAKL